MEFLSSCSRCPLLACYLFFFFLPTFLFIIIRFLGLIGFAFFSSLFSLFFPRLVSLSLLIVSLFLSFFGKFVAYFYVYPSFLCFAIHPFVSPSFCLFACLSSYHSVRSFTCLITYPSLLFVNLLFPLLVGLSVCLYVCLSMYLSVYLSLRSSVSFCVPFRLSTCPCVHLFFR